MSIIGRRCSFGAFFNLGSKLLDQMGSLSGFATMYVYETAEVEQTLQRVRVIDLRSDSTSKPCKEMRRAMFEADVGDDAMGEDPTVNELEKRGAKLFGKEASVFLTGGTMGNLIATMAHCDRRGCEIIVGDKSHMVLWEESGPAELAGVQMATVTNLADGTFNLDEMLDKVRDPNIHTSQTSLICVENTQNFCDGAALPLSWMEELAEIARRVKIPLHMDGARVFNAALCSGVSVAELVKDFASVSVCLNKGLGAPIGSLLVGDKAFINKARRLKKVLGGCWHQAGVVAAAGLYALDNMVVRLAVDHARTKAVAQAIMDTGTTLASIDMNKVQSNMFYIKFNTAQLTAQQFSQRLCTVTDEELKSLGSEEACVMKMFQVSSTEVRMVFCCNLSDEDVMAAIKKLQYILHEFEPNLS